MEDREAGAELVGEAEQVELLAEPAVVAPLRLLDPVQVGLEALLRRPGGAVDALQLLVLLVTAPVGGGAAHQPERRDALGGGQVRAAAEVLPGQRPVALEVVVDRQAALADLDARTLGGVTCGGLEADELELVRLVGQLVACVVVGDLAAVELLALLDDLAHPRLDGLQVVRGERLRHVEVVVEAVGDRRPDAELRLREQLLHGLGHDVGGGVPQDVEAVGRVDGDRLDGVAVAQLVGEVAELAADAGGDDVRLVGEQLPGLGSRVDRSIHRTGPRRRSGTRHTSFSTTRPTNGAFCLRPPYGRVRGGPRPPSRRARRRARRRP